MIPVGSGEHLKVKPDGLLTSRSIFFAASSSFRHFAASSFLPIASYSRESRSNASGMRVLPCGGIVFSRALFPHSP